jgi:hypothetical protein
MNSKMSEKRGFLLKELAMKLPLSSAYLCMEIKRGKLKSPYYGNHDVVLAEDWNDYIPRNGKTSNN